MKQNTPLRRRTPLRATKGLTAISSLGRTTRLRPSGPTRTKRRDTGPSTAVRNLVKARAQYRCEICGRQLVTVRGEIHHIHGRKIGGTPDPAINLPSNLLLLCLPHHDMVTNTRGNRTTFEDNGWLRRSGIAPAKPVLLHDGRRVTLSEDGRYLDVTGGAA